MRYDYTVIRFVPDLARGEFVNVGVIVGGDDGWTVKRMESAARARQLVHGGDYLAAARTTMDSIGDWLEEAAAHDEAGAPTDELPSKQWLEGLAASHRNVVQFTRPAPAVAESLDEAVSMLAEQLLVEPEQRS